MALLIIILNKIDLKKSFSLLSPIFLLVSLNPYPSGFCGQQVTESALTSLSMTPIDILSSVVKLSQKEERRKAGSGQPQTGEQSSQVWARPGGGS